MKLVIIFLFLFPFSAFAAEPLGVVINEIAWMGTDEGWYYEWIELYNNQNQEINLAGWKIENGGGKNKALEISSGEISPKGYFLICKKKIKGCDLETWGLSLNNNYQENGPLVLKDNFSNVIDQTPPAKGKEWPAGSNTKPKQTMERKNSQSAGSSPDNWGSSQNPGGTPKTKNSLVSQTEFPPLPRSKPQGETKTEAPDQTGSEIENQIQSPKEPVYPGNIFINEILPSPEELDAENEWIEIFNENNFKVDVSGWQIKYTIGTPRTYVFTNGTKIRPNEFLVLHRPQTKIILKNEGDTLELLNPNGEVVHQVTYEKALLGQSYNRTSSGWEWSTTLTPGKENIITQPETSEIKKNRSSIKKTEKVKEEENQKIPLEKLTSAKIGEGIPKSSNFLIIFLIAIGIAIASAVIVLILKKRLTEEELEVEETQYKL